MTQESRYAAASREELWSKGSLVESRLTCGEAIHDDVGIAAVDTLDADLISLCDQWIGALRQFLQPDLRMRLVAHATRESSSGIMVATLEGRSIVTTPPHAAADIELLRMITPHEMPSRRAPNGVPILWRNGSAAVLAHEAIGHPLEYGLRPDGLPEWIDFDVVLEQRRASFRDVPLTRMRHVRLAQSAAPFALASRRIEVLLLDGGGYDPLTDMVTIRVVVADLIDAGTITPLAPFEIFESREPLLRSIAGACGVPVRYPGVICSREGQELFVESFAPDLITETR